MSITLPEIKYHSLDNNMNLLFLHTDSNIFSCQITVEIGTNDEDEDESGFAHFFEHMIFKGSIGDKSIVDSIDFIGGRYNAATSHEDTTYYIMGINDYYEFIITTIIDMLYNPQFPENDIENEKKVVMEEYLMDSDDHHRQFFLKMFKVMFKDVQDSLTKNILGTEEHIKSYTRDKLLEFHKKRYLPGKKIMTIISNMDEKNILKVVKTKFNNIKPWIPEFETLNKELIVNHHKVVPETIYMNLPIQQCIVNICFRSINRLSLWILTSNIMSSILSSGSSSRLFDLLRNNLGLTYYQSAYSIYYDTHGLYIVSFGVRMDGLQLALSSVIDLLLNFKDVTEYELTKAKNGSEASIVFNTDSSLDIGATVINYVMSKRDPEIYRNIRKKIEAIKEKHVNNFAKKIFKRENMCVLIGGNEEQIRSIKLNI